MRSVFLVLIPLGLIAVASVLGMGFYSLFRGGAFAQTWSNKLMRLRVALQFATILLLGAALWWSQHNH
jgi:hypothetical protein